MKKINIMAVALGILAAILYLASMADYAFPGESVKLMACWRGLETPQTPPYPLMAVFAKLCGAGNIIAPICGAIAVFLVFKLVAAFIGWRLRAWVKLNERAGGRGSQERKKGSLKQKVLQSIKFPEVSAYFPLVKT